MKDSITTIAEAKKYLAANYKKGVSCPCCNQFVKLYKRNLNSGMARTLILIYKESDRYNASNYLERPFIHVKDFLRDNKHANGHDWTLLKYWGLLEDEATDKESPSSGLWRITTNGVDFVEGRLLVAESINFYNSKAYGHSEQSIGIIQALGKKFDYQELMK